MVFPARKQPEQPDDRYDLWPQSISSSDQLAFMWADYYTKLTSAFEEAVANTSGMRFVEAVSDLLARASEESTVYLLSDYTKSAEWKKDILPAIQEPQDTINALISYLASLNWGKPRISSFIPQQELVIEMGKDESELSEIPLCRIWTGAAPAIMDWLYGQGRTPEEKLSSFECIETRCRRNGDPLCRFEVKVNANGGYGKCVTVEMPKH